MTLQLPLGAMADDEHITEIPNNTPDTTPRKDLLDSEPSNIPAENEQVQREVPSKSVEVSKAYEDKIEILEKIVREHYIRCFCCFQ